jgi:putative ABC transport system permease protein
VVPIKYSVRSVMVRKATSAAAAIGIGLVVFVLATAMMLVAGLSKTMGASGSDDVAIVLRKGADAELGSGVEDTQISLIKAMPGVAKGEAGQGTAVGEVVVVSALEKLGTEGITNVQIRGIPAEGFAFRKNAKIVQGRAPKPGTDEAAVGARIAGRFKGIGLNQKFEIKKNRFVEIVGVFEDAGSSYESEVWADVDTVRTSYGRTGVSSVRVQLEKDRYEAFKAAVESDKRLGLMVMRESEYYEKQSEGTRIFIMAIGILLTFFVSAGAIIGAMNTMYSAVANRRREIGILRALGFSRFAILFSFVLESLVLSLMGGAAGMAGAVALGRQKISMMNFASWSEIVFSFDVTPRVLVTSMILALVMGFIGGFLPALRAAFTPPVVAMRG